MPDDFFKAWVWLHVSVTHHLCTCIGPLWRRLLQGLLISYLHPCLLQLTWSIFNILQSRSSRTGVFIVTVCFALYILLIYSRWRSCQATVAASLLGLMLLKQLPQCFQAAPNKAKGDELFWVTSWGGKASTSHVFLVSKLIRHVSFGRSFFGFAPFT